MQKFIVMYMAPAAMMAEWMKKPESDRKGDEEKMMADWKTWTEAHSAMIKESNASGKNLRVSKDGTAMTPNDLMLYSIVEAESQEAAAENFKNHPHFGIPGATIDIMPIRPM